MIRKQLMIIIALLVLAVTLSACNSEQEKTVPQDIHSDENKEHMLTQNESQEEEKTAENGYHTHNGINYHKH
jgi:predicted small secreted protein